MVLTSGSVNVKFWKSSLESRSKVSWPKVDSYFLCRNCMDTIRRRMYVRSVCRYLTFTIHISLRTEINIILSTPYRIARVGSIICAYIDRGSSVRAQVARRDPWNPIPGLTDSRKQYIPFRFSSHQDSSGHPNLVPLSAHARERKRQH